MAVKPISPDEAYKERVFSIPDEIIEAVNNLLIKNVSKGGYATILQKDIEALALGKFLANGKVVSVSSMYENNWFDFEDLFRAAGWKVEYDRPAYNESYDASFKFSKAK